MFNDPAAQRAAGAQIEAARQQLEETRERAAEVVVKAQELVREIRVEAEKLSWQNVSWSTRAADLATQLAELSWSPRAQLGGRLWP